MTFVTCNQSINSPLQEKTNWCCNARFWFCNEKHLSNLDQYIKGIFKQIWLQQFCHWWKWLWVYGMLMWDYGGFGFFSLAINYYGWIYDWFVSSAGNHPSGIIHLLLSIIPALECDYFWTWSSLGWVYLSIGIWMNTRMWEFFGLSEMGMWIYMFLCLVRKVRGGIASKNEEIMCQVSSFIRGWGPSSSSIVILPCKFLISDCQMCIHLHPLSSFYPSTSLSDSFNITTSLFGARKNTYCRACHFPSSFLDSNMH